MVPMPIVMARRGTFHSPKKSLAGSVVLCHRQCLAALDVKRDGAAGTLARTEAAWLCWSSPSFASERPAPLSADLLLGQEAGLFHQALCMVSACSTHLAYSGPLMNDWLNAACSVNDFQSGRPNL
jgi:hypothetical protein